ncbi:hypothetical protein QYM36_010688 [Artemia franciscana]|uniref:Uncharacterized protein n=1 Tax=Artemia franciscana TaxID=6661 RepID=A0AA88HXV3_ARTSF|nr:hypothetical protein QYM36_010688 [Artemia franciscana]
MAEEDLGYDVTDGKSDSKSRRIRPWDSLLRKFFKKGRQSDPQPLPEPPKTFSGTTSTLFCIRSRSASDLSSIDIPIERSNRSPVIGDAYASGIAVSHDSIFPTESFDNEEEEETSTRTAPKQILLTSVQDELRAALIRRQTKINSVMGESEEDLGFPRSPASVSPPSRDPLGFSRSGGQSAIFGLRNRKGSDGSMLSMDYTEQDEDFILTGNSSSFGKVFTIPVTLEDKTYQELEQDGDLAASFPLNHAAARHKMAVRPKRAHVTSRARHLQHLSSVEEIKTNSEDKQNEERKSRPQGLPPRGSVQRTESKRSSSQVRIPAQPPDVTPKLRSVSLTRSTDRSPSPPRSPLSRVSRSRSSADRRLQYEIQSFQRRNSSTSPPISLLADVTNPHDGSLSPVEPQNIFSRFFPRRRSSRKNSTELPVTKPNLEQDLKSPPALPPKERDVSRKSSFISENKPEVKNWRISADVEHNSNDNSVDQETLNFASFFDRIREGSKNITKPVPIPRKSLLASPNSEDKGYESLNITPDSSKPRKLSREEPQDAPIVRPWVKVLPTVNVNDLRRPFDETEPSLPKFRKQISLEPRNELPSRPARRVHSFRGSTTTPLALDSLKFNEKEAKSNESDKSPESLSGIDLNGDFILKKAVESNPAAHVIRRSLETLKFSNEGLKKTISSLNRYSQSSDQLILPDDVINKNSNDSLSTGSSSLNISDTEGLGSSYTLSRESLISNSKANSPQLSTDSSTVKGKGDGEAHSEYTSLSPKTVGDQEEFFEALTPVAATLTPAVTPTTPVVLRSFLEPFNPPEIKSRIVTETAQLFGKFSDKAEKNFTKKLTENEMIKADDGSEDIFPEVVLRKKTSFTNNKLNESQSALLTDLELKSSVFGLILKSKFSEMQNSNFQSDNVNPQPLSLDSNIESERPNTFEVPSLRKFTEKTNDTKAVTTKKDDFNVLKPIKPERTSLMKKSESAEGSVRNTKVPEPESVEIRRPVLKNPTESSELLQVFARRSLKLRETDTIPTESKTEDTSISNEEEKEVEKTVIIELPKTVSATELQNNVEEASRVHGKPIQLKCDKSRIVVEPTKLPMSTTKESEATSAEIISKRKTFQTTRHGNISPENLQLKSAEVKTDAKLVADLKENKIEKEVFLIKKEKPSPRAVRLRSKTLPEANYTDLTAAKTYTDESTEPQSISVPSYGVTLRPTGNLIVNRALRLESGLENANNIWKRISVQQKNTNVTTKISEETEVAKKFASRQSKVLDIVNNFQRLQVT